MWVFFFINLLVASVVEIWLVSYDGEIFKRGI